MGSRWVSAAVLVAALAALGLQTSVVTRTGFLMGDFRAFYCAARVASDGADPYRAEPLRSCELGIGSTPFFEKNPGVTIPAPLPGYAIAALMPIARLPFAVAASVWGALLAFALIACIVLLARFGRVSWQMALAVFGLSLGMLSLPFGEVVPLAVACICASAYLARQGRHRAAAIAAAGAMIEPHLGLPVCIALALWLPRARLPLALAFGALGALSLAVLGPATNLEYFASVLPAHALSEVSRDTQYSLTAVLAALGISQGAAIRGGSLWYAAMLVCGVVVAGALAKKAGNNAFVVCVPPAFAVFGGTFIHITQIAAALPAAVLLAGFAKGAYRTGAIVALLLLAVPWASAILPASIIAPLFPVGYLAWCYWSGNLRVALLAALGATALLLGLTELFTTFSHAATHAAAPVIDLQLAEASWSRFTQQSSTNDVAAWILRLPTWAGLALLLVLLVRAAGTLERFRAKVPALALGAICTVVPIVGQLYGDRSNGWLMVDFRAYYCASLAQRNALNPYFTASLHDCEAGTPTPYYRAPANVTVPAPYPPYVLAMLYPLTFLPFASAAIVWWIALAVALALAAYALARISGQPVLVGWAALALSLGLTTFSSGNLMPLALAAVLVAALCVGRGRPLLAVPAIAVALVEPQIALPAAGALFVAYPSVRVALVLAIGALGALSVAGGGFAQTVGYVTAVIPAHALAEVSRDNQYSLATVVAALGVSDTAAVAIGSLSYVVMTVLGVLIALRLARCYDEPALVLLVPPAFALLGGSFVHTVEIAAAVPSALVLFARAPTYRGWLFAALILLAVPWMLATSVVMFLAPLFPVAYLTYVLWRKERVAALAAAVSALTVIVALFVLASSGHPHPVAGNHVYPPIDPRLAEMSWRQLVLGNSTNRPVTWLLRLPTWIGLMALAIPALIAASKPRLMLALHSA